MAAGPATVEPYAVVLRRAALWLLFLAPFFYLTYGFANWLASQRQDVGFVVFDWERGIPFIAWTIVPYWSINLFYALSLAVNDTRRGVDRLACRYLTVQIVAVACFILFPLQATFLRPQTSGIPGFMFAVLGGFDKPFNQAPSLHIALLVIIWDHWRHHLSGVARAIWHAWCLLIGLSVLTTWQHHAIDIPTGALLGLFALWLFPAKDDPPLSTFQWTADRQARRLALYYACGAFLLLAATVAGAFRSPLWLCALWPALSLAIVATSYFGCGPGIFEKRCDGTVSLASRILLLPYRMGARINAFLWTRKLSSHALIGDGVFLGRFPTTVEATAFSTVIDLAAEFEKPKGFEGNWVSIPMLDLVPPRPEASSKAADEVEMARGSGPVLVCCALGFQRSACVIADWLIGTGRAKTYSEAEAILRAAGRPVHLRGRRAVFGEFA